MTRRVTTTGSAFLLLAVLILALSLWQPSQVSGSETRQTGDVPRANLPYDVPASQRAIFWFGEVYQESNSANVRLGYNDSGLQVHVHAFDRRLWWDTSPTVAELTEWDAATLYLAPSGSAVRHRFTGQMTPNGDARGLYQVAYRNEGSGWQPANTPFTVETGWRGEGVNDQVDDRGWWIGFTIPYSALGLSGPPAPGTIWRAAIEMHDRDSEAGPPSPVQTWPEPMSSGDSASWAELRFGLPSPATSAAVTRGEVTIRHGLNGAVVPDAHVGGHSTCGKTSAHWTEWGNTNFAGYGQINVQNQWDVADWPCYSRYYVTFPLDAIPASADAITSATLTMHQFGSAGQEAEEPPPPSYIQVLTVDESWDENTLTWNNSPAAAENHTGAWVDPFDGDDHSPGWPIEWDITRAAAEAFAAGEPLRLAIYSADTAYNSGRYFWSSDVGDYMVEARPRLDVEWGEFVNLPNSHFLPFLTGQ